MIRIDFAALGIAALILIGFFVFWRKKRQEVPPHFLYSRMANFSPEVEGRHVRYQLFENVFFLLSLFFLLAAFLDPRAVSRVGGDRAEPLYTEGRAIYFVLDVSSSMEARVIDVRAGREDTLPTRIDLLKELTAEFIDGRPQDLIGLASFARAAWVLAPLTRNHEMLKGKLEKLEVVPGRDYDGTAIGYAIYKIASLIGAANRFSEKEGAYDIKGAAMILVTDGFHSPHPEDSGRRLRTMGLREAAEHAKEQDARLFIVNIDPIIEDPEFAPERRLMQRVAEETGGGFFAAADTERLQEVYSAIDEMEESRIPEPPAVFRRRFSFYPFLVLMGLIALSGAMILETLIVKKVP